MAKNKKADNKSAKAGTHKVIKEFRDINDFNKNHSIGDDVSHFDAHRLKGLVETGMVEETETDSAEETETDLNKENEGSPGGE